MYNYNMKKIGRFAGVLLGVFFLGMFVYLPVVSAVGKDCIPSEGKICNPITATTVQGVIKFALEAALKVGLPVVALALIYSGFLFVFARGNPEGITKAKDTLLYTLIGAAILLGAWSIAKLINATVISIGS
jgi:hypothetical protein